MKKTMFLLGLMTLVFACKKGGTIPQPASTPTKSKTISPKEECYVYNANGSSVELQFERKGNEVFGTLNYTLAEKDRNTGTINGKLENNILLAEYTFQSEGKESTRQVIFQLKDHQFIEGYGEMTNDGTHFKDSAKVTFTSTMPLNKTDCTK